MMNSYKYDFLKFIDSPDIRKHVANEVFTPAEQAVLISMNVNQPVVDKVSALKYLLDAYSEDEFGKDQVVGHGQLERSGIKFKEVVQRKVMVWEDAWNSRHETGNVVYATYFNEKGFAKDYIGAARFFSTYDMAYSYLKECKAEYLTDTDLEDVQVFGRILQIPVDSQYNWHDSTEFRFDNELQLIEILESTRRYHTDEDNYIPDLKEAFYVYVPLPWKAGDLVKEISLYFGDHFGILRNNYPKREEDWRIQYDMGDASDMRVVLDTYDSETNKWDYMDNVNVLSLKSCTEVEFAKNRYMIEACKKREHDSQ